MVTCTELVTERNFPFNLSLIIETLRTIVYRQDELFEFRATKAIIGWLYSGDEENFGIKECIAICRGMLYFQKTLKSCINVNISHIFILICNKRATDRLFATKSDLIE